MLYEPNMVILSFLFILPEVAGCRVFVNPWVTSIRSEDGGYASVTVKAGKGLFPFHIQGIISLESIWNNTTIPKIHEQAHT